MTILKMQFPRERLVLKTCGNKLPYGRAFIWTNGVTPITKFKITVSTDALENLNGNNSNIYHFLEKIYYYILCIEKFEGVGLRYSLTRMTYDKTGTIDNKDVARCEDLIHDAKICDYDKSAGTGIPAPCLDILESRITSLINQLHPQGLNAKFEVYAVKSPGGE